MSEGIDRFKTVLQGFDARVQAAAGDAWSKPAPCEGWVARDVVVHVANNMRRFTGADPVGESDDIVAAWNATRDGMEQALAAADPTATVQGPFGPMPLDQLMGQIMAMDTLVHTWDLARAVGGDERLPADIVTGAYAGLKPMDAMIRQPGLFGPKVEVPADADEQTQFLSFLGRTV